MSNGVVGVKPQPSPVMPQFEPGANKCRSGAATPRHPNRLMRLVHSVESRPITRLWELYRSHTATGDVTVQPPRSSTTKQEVSVGMQRLVGHLATRPARYHPMP
jgi:hypothetical protein